MRILIIILLGVISVLFYQKRIENLENNFDTLELEKFKKEVKTGYIEPANFIPTSKKIRILSELNKQEPFTPKEIEHIPHDLWQEVIDYDK